MTRVMTANDHTRDRVFLESSVPGTGIISSKSGITYTCRRFHVLPRVVPRFVSPASLQIRPSFMTEEPPSEAVSRVTSVELDPGTIGLTAIWSINVIDPSCMR